MGMNLGASEHEKQGKRRKGWVQMSRSYDYVPRDIVFAFNVIVAQRYGNGDIRNAVRGIRKRMRWTNWTMPGRQAVPFSNTEIGYRRWRELVIGSVEIIGIRGEFTLFGTESVVTAVVPESSHDEAAKLLGDIQQHLEAHSLYRGAAFNNSYEFINPAVNDFSKLVYNQSVERDLRAHLWTLFERSDACRGLGLPRQSKVLFTGGFGTGKSMALLLTAKVALENDWTFINVEQTVDPSSVIEGALQHGRRYAPTLLGIEDFDREDRTSNPRAMSLLLNAIDGIMTKVDDLVVIMTTNYPNKIPAELQRPGRTDAIIDFDTFEQEDRVRLLKKVVPADVLQPDIDWDEVEKAWDQYAPAFVNRIGESAMLYAISESDPPRVTQEMLITAAERLRRQHNACQRAMGFSN